MGFCLVEVHQSRDGATSRPANPLHDIPTGHPFLPTSQVPDPDSANECGETHLAQCVTSSFVVSGPSLRSQWRVAEANSRRRRWPSQTEYVCAVTLHTSKKKWAYKNTVTQTQATCSHDHTPLCAHKMHSIVRANPFG